VSDNLKTAQKIAQDNGLVYSPDGDAILWMNKLSDLIRQEEREICARLCEDSAMAEAAKILRRQQPDFDKLYNEFLMRKGWMTRPQTEQTFKAGWDAAKT